MKRHILIFTILTGIISIDKLSSQDWQIVNPNYHYHYVLYDSLGGITDSLDAYTVRVDHTEGDTIFFNQWLRENILKSKIESVNIFTHHFLRRRMIKSRLGEVLFQSPGEIRFIIPEKPGQSWVFDSQADIKAELDAIYTAEIYGEIDSIKSIALSSGDIILWSRSFGILQFPVGYGKNEYYRQIGISGPDVGFTFPKMDDFYGFVPGDRFKYETGIHLGKVNHISYYKKLIWQFEIIDTVRENGIMHYLLDENLCEIRWEANYFHQKLQNSTSSFHSARRWDKLDIKPFEQWDLDWDSERWWTTYPHEAFYGPFGDSTFAPISSGKFLDKASRLIDFSNCVMLFQDSTLTCNSIWKWSGDVKWIKGLGLFVEKALERSFGSKRVSVDLKAWHVKGKSFGNSTAMYPEHCRPMNTDEWVPPLPVPPKEKEFSITHTNPVTNGKISITFPQEHEYASISLIDMSGRLIYYYLIKEENKLEIVTSSWAAGVYRLLLRDHEGQILVQKKIVIL